MWDLGCLLTPFTDHADVHKRDEIPVSYRRLARYFWKKKKKTAVIGKYCTPTQNVLNDQHQLNEYDSIQLGGLTGV